MVHFLAVTVDFWAAKFTILHQNDPAPLKMPLANVFNTRQRLLQIVFLASPVVDSRHLTRPEFLGIISQVSENLELVRLLRTNYRVSYNQRL